MPRDVRARRNAQLFREVNDRIHELEASWISGEPIAFVCECSELGCMAPVYLTVDEFRQVRAEPDRFVALPVHVDPEHEQVVARTERYVVVMPIESFAAQAPPGADG